MSYETAGSFGFCTTRAQHETPPRLYLLAASARLAGGLEDWQAAHVCKQRGLCAQVAVRGAERGTPT
jgi:hypothetical protein